MQNVVIMGASGIVGSVLAKGLAKDFNVTPLSKEDCDMTKWSEVQEKIPNDTDVIIHMAWDTNAIYEPGNYNNTNVLMALNAYEIAVEKNIPRVIMASSVHAHEYRTGFVHRQSIPMSLRAERSNPNEIATSSRRNVGTPRNDSAHTTIDWPTSIYGATKLYLEALGRYYAAHRDLEVICVRLGGVNLQNSPTAHNEIDYEKVFLSHEDLISIFTQLITHEDIEDNYLMRYAISGK